MNYCKKYRKYVVNSVYWRQECPSGWGVNLSTSTKAASHQGTQEPTGEGAWALAIGRTWAKIQDSPVSSVNLELLFDPEDQHSESLCTRWYSREQRALGKQPGQEDHVGLGIRNFTRIDLTICFTFTAGRWALGLRGAWGTLIASCCPGPNPPIGKVVSKSSRIIFLMERLWRGCKVPLMSTQKHSAQTGRRWSGRHS